MRVVFLAVFCWSAAYGQGFTLVERVDDGWRRLEDRHGRLDPDGALLQLHAPLYYIEYALDREIARPPFWMERDWVNQPNAVRFFVQSLNEFELTNELQLKTQAPLGSWGRFGLRVDRVERREGQSTLVRTDFGAEDIAGSGWFAGLSLTPRWEKEDADVELFVGLETSAGRARLRLIALDPFVNAAHALAESREARVERSADQQDAPLAWTVDFQSARVFGLRAEVYVGVVLPAATRYTFADPKTAGFERSHEAALGGGLLEWHDALPLWVGVSATHIVAETAWTGGRVQRIDEASTELRAYAYADLPAAWEVAAEAIWTRGRSDSVTPDATVDRAERRLTSSVKAHWMPGTVGMELGIMRADRDVLAYPEALPEGADHRLVTRCLVQFGPEVWMAVGVGWDLDPGDTVYDGGGFTLIAHL